MRLLYFKGSTPKKALDEITEVYEDDSPSYDVVIHWHGQFKCGHTLVKTVPIPVYPL